MGLSLDEVAQQAITRFALRMVQQGIIPCRLIPFSETNRHRLVDAGRAPNFLDAVDTLAEDCLKYRIRVMAELPTVVIDRGPGQGQMISKVVTDRDHGFSLRILLGESGVVFEAAYKGDGETVN